MQITYNFFFQNDTFRVVWAYSDTDPPEYGIDAGAEEAGGGDLFASLPPGVRTGSRSLHLYESTKLRGLRAQTDSLKWTVASNSVVLPPKDTLYWCTMLKLPTLPGTSSNKKTALLKIPGYSSLQYLNARKIMENELEREYLE